MLTATSFRSYFLYYTLLLRPLRQYGAVCLDSDITEECKKSKKRIMITIRMMLCGIMVGIAMAIVVVSVVVIDCTAGPDSQMFRLPHQQAAWNSETTSVHSAM